MNTLTDQELIETLHERFGAHQRALNDLRAVTMKLEQANSRLKESEALKGHFLSNIRNEINNPLTSIMGLALQLADGNRDFEQVSRMGQMIHAEAFALEFQLENIFVAAELEAGEANPLYIQVNIAAIVDETAQQMTLSGSGKNIIIAIEVPSKLSFVTDPRMMQLIIRNLLSNAMTFGPESSTVHLSLRREGNTLQVAVRDEGAGIEPGMRARIFDRFHQGEIGSEKSHRGHGLGLSVSIALAELLGGTIVQENTPGQGCLFTLTLPEGAADSESTATDGNLFFFDQAEQF